MRKILLSSLSCILLLSGCWDAKEIEQQIYIHSVGLDYHKGKFHMYGQVISFENLAKQEGPMNRKPTLIDIVKGTGNSIDEAGFDFYPSAQQRISWEHVTAIIYSERLLKAGKLKEVNDFITRFIQIRNVTWTFGTNGSIEDLLFSSPILGSSPLFSQLSNPDDIFRQLSYIPPVQLFRLQAAVLDQPHIATLPYLSLTKQRWKEHQKKKAMLIMNGIGIVENGKLTQFIDRKDLEGYRWVNNETIRTKIKIPEGNKTIAVGPAINIKSKLVPKVISEEKVIFDLSVKLNFSILQLNKTLSSSELERSANEMIKTQISDLYRKSKEKNIDLFKFSQTVYRKDVHSWKKININGKIPLSKIELRNITVKSHLTNSGELLQRSVKNE